MTSIELILLISFVIIIVSLIIGRILDSLPKNRQKKDEDFNVKYPGLNYLLVLSVLVFLSTLSIMILQFMFGKFKAFINWLSNISTKIDAVIIVALISGTISIIGIVISSIISKVIDYRKRREEYLSQKREVPYGEFIEMVYRLTENIKTQEKYSRDDMIKDIYKFSKQMTLWGSPKVVSKWIEFREVSIKGIDDNSVNNLLTIESLMNEMRKDLGVKKVKKGQLLGFFINDVKKIFNVK